MDIHTKTGQILNRGSGSAQQVSGPAGGGGVGYDYTATLQVPPCWMKCSLHFIDDAF